jgi:hypothetical protein
MSSERINYYNYFTEIEEHFVRRRGKHLLISPMDWGLIAAWRDAGIPLQVALRGIDIAMDGFFSRQRRGSAKINSLCYCHDSVMAEYDAYRESRVGEPEEGIEGAETAASPPQKEENETGSREAVEYLTGISREIKALMAERSLSESVLEGLKRVQDRLKDMLMPVDSGRHVDLETLERDLGMADAILVETLLTAIPKEEIKEWEKEAKAELKVYRKKLPKEMFSKIYDNFIHGKVHQAFNIREFSLFRL